jgi:hypothetical protein
MIALGSAQEYAHLFTQSGFRLTKVIPIATAVSIIAAAPEVKS